MGKYIIHNGCLYDADELRHHGVKGMKWGVRRNREQLGYKNGSKRTRKTSSDAELNNKIEAIGNHIGWGKDNQTKKLADDICREIITTRKPSEHDKFLSRLSLLLDGNVHDDPSVMSVNKKTGAMRYNSTVKFDQRNILPDSKTGLYNTSELDRVLGHEPGSTYYYVWGECQNHD
jgi:hypothetical protein